MRRAAELGDEEAIERLPKLEALVQVFECGGWPSGLLCGPV